MFTWWITGRASCPQGALPRLPSRAHACPWLREDLIHRLIDFCVLKRTLRRLEHQPQGGAPKVFPFFPEVIRHKNASHMRLFHFFNKAHDSSRLLAYRNLKSQVPLHEGKSEGELRSSTPQVSSAEPLLTRRTAPQF